MKNRTVIIFILIACCVIVGLNYYTLQQSEKINQLDLENANLISQVIESRLTTINSQIEISNNHLQTMTDLDLLSFEQFANAILKNNSMIQSVGWAPIVSDKERLHYERDKYHKEQVEFHIKKIDQDGFLIPASYRRFYTPLDMLIGSTDHKRLKGLDLSHNAQVFRYIESEQKEPYVTNLLTVQGDTILLLLRKVYNSKQDVVGLFFFAVAKDKLLGVNEFEPYHIVMNLGENKNIVPHSNEVIHKEVPFHNAIVNLTLNKEAKVKFNPYIFVNILLLIIGGMFFVWLFSQLYAKYAIFEKRKLNYKIKEAEKAKNAANAIRDVKVSVLNKIIRDFYEPFKNINNLLNMYSKTNMNLEQEELHSLVMSSNNEISYNFSMLSDYVKLEYGNIQLHNSIINLEKDTYTSIQSLNRLLIATQTTFFFYYDQKIPKNLFADKEKIQRLINKTLHFVLDKVTVKYIIVEVKLNRKRDELSQVDINIIVPGSQLSEVIQLQNRYHHSNAFGLQNFGSYFSYSQKLVEILNGKIVTQAHQHQDCLTISLPLKHSRLSHQLNCQMLSGNTILLLDANPISRDIMTKYLLSWGVTVFDFENLDQAVYLFTTSSNTKQQIDCIIANNTTNQITDLAVNTFSELVQINKPVVYICNQELANDSIRCIKSLYTPSLLYQILCEAILGETKENTTESAKIDFKDKKTVSLFDENLQHSADYPQINELNMILGEKYASLVNNFLQQMPTMLNQFNNAITDNNDNQNDNQLERIILKIQSLHRSIGLISMSEKLCVVMTSIDKYTSERLEQIYIELVNLFKDLKPSFDEFLKRSETKA